MSARTNTAKWNRPARKSKELRLILGAIVRISQRRSMHFRIKTYSRTEGVLNSTIVALSEADLRRRLEAEGRQIVSIRRAWRLPGMRKAHYPILEFSQELLALLEAGLSLPESLEVQSRKAGRAESRQVLVNLLEGVKAGKGFSNALAEEPEVFPTLFVAMVRASEQTGDLVETIRRFIAYQQQADLVRNRVVSAAIYPMLLIGVGTLVVAFLLVYVIPRFSRIYEDLGKDLPWSSRLMVGWSNFVGHYGLLLALAFIGILVGVIHFATATSTRASFERFLWSLPGVGERIKLYHMARFTRTLAMLVRGGIPFVFALGLVSDLLRQPGLKTGLRKAKQSISEGKSVSDAFANASLSTEVGIRLLAVGENSGSMAETLERIAQLYDDEIARWVDRFSKLFEPALMLVIGASIGLIVILMYMPIFELANSLQ